MWSLRSARRAIVVAGCCGTAYLQLTTSPATVEFSRTLGATGFHIGLLGALPTAMLFTQLFAALAVRKLPQRRWVWFWMSLVHRLLYVPVALGAWLYPEWPPTVWLWLLIAATAVSQGMLHFCSPLWLSWMGDYLPHQGLSAYWGVRQLWTQWTAAGATLLASVLLFKADIDVLPAFALVIGLGAALGVLDVLLFLRVEEPPVTPLPSVRFRDLLAEPFRDANYRSFIRYVCFWHVAAMIGAPFISMYLLEHVGMDLYSVLLLWTCSWIGGAVSSRRLGGLVEACGQRPVLVLCTLFKSISMLALLLTPRDPTWAFWFLAPVFMFDQVLNGGISLACNQFMVKESPRDLRTAFIAAGTAPAGLIGGVAAIVSGLALTWLEPFGATIAGFQLVNFHYVFAVSLILRVWAIAFARQVQEPAALPTRLVLRQMLAVARRETVVSYEEATVVRLRVVSAEGQGDETAAPISPPSRRAA